MLCSFIRSGRKISSFTCVTKHFSVGVESEPDRFAHLFDEDLAFVVLFKVLEKGNSKVGILLHCVLAQ